MFKLDPETIAGAILSLYFIFKGILSIKSKKNNNELDSVKDQAFRDSMHDMSREINEIHERIEEWDDLVKAGIFSCKWKEREVTLIQERINRLNKDKE